MSEQSPGRDERPTEQSQEDLASPPAQPSTTRAAVAAAVPLPAPAFARTRWGRIGYDCDEVDEFVVALRRAVVHDPPAMAPYEVADQRFRARRWTRSYDLRSVDDYLDQAQQALRARHGNDAVAGLEGRVAEPRHVRTWWIYLIALVLVAVVVGVTVSQL